VLQGDETDQISQVESQQPGRHRQPASSDSEFIEIGNKKSGQKQFLAVHTSNNKGRGTSTSKKQKHQSSKDEESDEAREVRGHRGHKKKRPTSSSSEMSSSSSSSSNSSSSSSSSEKLRVSKQNSSKKYIEYSQRKKKTPSTEAIFKLIKKVKLAKHLSPHKHAIVLYLVSEVQDVTFMGIMGDLNEKGLQQFLTFMRSKADEVLNTLMQRY